MKPITRYLRAGAALVAALLLYTAPAFAQTTLTNTTLSAAITNASDRTMTIASATGWTASTTQAQRYAIIDREVVGVLSLSSTNVGITRGQQGTRATGHSSGATVYFVDAPLSNVILLGFDRAGACSTTGSADVTQNGLYVPVFNPTTGRAFTCLGSKWVLVSTMMGVTPCTVTQATSKSTGVTCSSSTGTITMNNAALGAAAEVGFTVTNTHIAASDVVVVNIKSGATADSYQTTVDAVAAGSFRISLSNVSGGSLGEAVVLNFRVVKD